MTAADATWRVVDVRKAGVEIWHTIEADDVGLPAVDATVCGVIWNEYRRFATGNNMEPLKARIDYEFDPLPDGFAERVEALVTDEIAADRQITVAFLPRDTAVEDEELIRTKVNLIPESVSEIRVVDIAGLDKQADGGTHVASTAAIGSFRMTKTESKGKGNKRIRFELGD